MTDIDWSEVADDVRAVGRGAVISSRFATALALASSLCVMRWQQTRGMLSDDTPTPVRGTPRVCVESPLRGDVARNRLYAECCMFDSLVRDEAPFLGHLLYPHVLDDAQSYDRERGINAHLAWLRRSDVVAVYLDLGLSGGMAEAVELARSLHIPVVERKLGGDWRRMSEQLRATQAFGGDDDNTKGE